MAGIVSREWKVDGKKPLNPQLIYQTASRAGWPMDWHGQVNSLNCPRGQHWGRGEFLLSNAAIGLVDLTGPIDITIEHEDGTTTFTGYYAMLTRAITQDPNNPGHWVTFADRRWILSRTAANKRYNLRAAPGEYVAATTNGGTAYTWQEIIDDLWSLLPASVAGTAPTLDSPPSSTPENLVFDGISAWRAINQVLIAAGHVAVLDPTTGTFSAEAINATQTGLATLKSDNESRRLWAMNHQDLPETNYPENVVVTFHYHPDIDNPDAPFRKQPATETKALGAGGTEGDWPIVDTLFATDSNAAARSSRADEIKETVAGIFRPYAEPFGAAYAGVIEFIPGSELTDVQWISDGTRGMMTVARYYGGEFEWPELLDEGGGGAGESISFIIVSASDASGSGDFGSYKSASVTILTASCGRHELVGTTVTVYDIIGCYLNEDNADLVDRKGHAEWCVMDNGGETDCFWEIKGLCCPP